MGGSGETPPPGDRARVTSFTILAGARLIGDAQGSGAALNTILRRLAIGAALAGILGTLWILKAQTVTVIEMLAEHVHSAGARGAWNPSPNPNPSRNPNSNPKPKTPP